ncbi:MAG: hypothetical protein Q4A63_00725 [Butyricicoccus pullicaecorum]|nr:hypothetical protein [Butyricicoccus pullicaecorum]
MDDKILQLLLVQQKKKYIQLTEVLNVTVQMAEAIERDDNVSMSLLIAMRQEPLLLIDEIQQAVGERLESLPAGTAAHLRALLTGRGTEKAVPEEQALDDQCQMNFRLLSRIVAIDKRLNKKVGKGQSYYKD